MLKKGPSCDRIGEHCLLQLEHRDRQPPGRVREGLAQSGHSSAQPRARARDGRVRRPIPSTVAAMIVRLRLVHHSATVNRTVPSQLRELFAAAT